MKIATAFINASAFEETQLEPKRPMAQGEAEIIQDAYLRVFTTREGQIVLDDLISRTMGMPTFNAGLGLLEGVAVGFAREGQNALVAQIIRTIERAKKEKELNNGTSEN